MKRFVGAVLTCALLVTPVFAAESSKTEEKEKIQQCKSEYKEAKRLAGEKKTKTERKEAKSEAKKHYKECTEKAKHRT